MDKEEILNEIEKTKEHLANMEKMLEKCDEKWKPEEGEIFYYLNSYNIAISETWNASYSDAGHYNIYNCFKTREQAEQEAEKVLVRRQLEDIARRLNKGENLDWSNNSQGKYYLYLWLGEELEQHIASVRLIQGVIYCLDSNFLNVAIQEIGEERLKKYLRGE